MTVSADPQVQHPKLDGGDYIVLAWAEIERGWSVVLVVHEWPAARNGTLEWVTWEVNEKGDRYSGHYLIEEHGETLLTARQDFLKRLRWVDPTRIRSL